MVAALDLDIRRVVVGGSEWEHHAPVVVGDRLAGRRVVTAVVVKDGGMTIITLETALHRGDGQLAVIQRDTVIELAR
jgi:acyl dehydratase